MPKYTDKRMLELKSVEGFKPMEQNEFTDGLNQVEHKNIQCAKALLIILYYTGCRPEEALRLTVKSFNKKGPDLWIFFQPIKGGNVGSLTLPLRNPHIKELAEYVLQGWTPEYPVFAPFIGVPKSGKKDRSYKVRYLVKKYFNTVPYFLRHNRFSRAALQGAMMRELQALKRAKSENSVYFYLHFSRRAKAGLKKFMRD